MAAGGAGQTGVIWQISNVNSSQSVLSQAPGAPYDGLYKYNAQGQGRGITVYVFDSGADTTHEAYRAIGGGRRRFLHIPQNPYPRDTDESVDFTTPGHGTLMADQIAGRRGGVAKQANLVICALGQRPANIDRFAWGWWYLCAVVDDIRARGLEGKAIVNISNWWNVVLPEQAELAATMFDWLWDIFEELYEMGILVVVASATESKSTDRDIYAFPQCLAHVYYLPLLVVEPVNRRGTRMNPRDPLPPDRKICACGTFETLAQAETYNEYTSGGGADIAAAAVSALAACHLSEPAAQTVLARYDDEYIPGLLTRFMQSLAHRRCPSGPRVAWNGVGGPTNGTASGPGGPPPSFAEWIEWFEARGLNNEIFED